MAEDIKKIVEDYKEETKRHFDVVAERLEDKIGVVSEQVVANTEKITSVQEKLEQYDKEFTGIKDTLEVIKLDIEFIKNELKQKVGRDEFAALERRVSILEAKIKK